MRLQDLLPHGSHLLLQGLALLDEGVDVGDLELVHLKVLIAGDEGLDGLLQGVVEVLLPHQLHVRLYRLGGHAVAAEEEVLILSC